jgi:hypothetical protein
VPPSWCLDYRPLATERKLVAIRLTIGMLSRLRSFFQRAAPPNIEITSTGFALRTRSGEVTPVQWSGVRRAFAYKRDHFTTDCVMLVLELDEPDGAVLELSEEWPGFSALFDAMEAALGVRPGWYLEVMTPAFEPTPRIVYERPGLDPSTPPPAA